MTEDDVVVVLSSNGVWTTIPAAMAHHRVAELFGNIDVLVQKFDDWGYLPDDEAQRARANYAEAEDLVRQMEPAGAETDSLERFYRTDPSAEQHLAKRAESVERERDRQHARRIAEVARMVESLGDDDDDEPESAPPPESKRRATVTRSADHLGELWTVTGGDAPPKRYAVREVAEAEARRRVGLTG